MFKNTEGVPGSSDGKESICSVGDLGSIPGATHSSILICRTPWTEEPGELQSDMTEQLTHTHTRIQKSVTSAGSEAHMLMLQYILCDTG